MLPNDLLRSIKWFWVTILICCVPSLFWVASVLLYLLIKNVCIVAGEASLMETDDTQSRKHSRRTLRDQHGQYPVWMNQRAIRKRKNGAAVTRRRAKVKRGSGKKLKKWLDVCSGQRHQRCDLNVNKGYTPSCHHLCTMSWCGVICSRPRIVAMAIPNICTPSICCDVVIFCNISY